MVLTREQEQQIEEAMRLGPTDELVNALATYENVNGSINPIALSSRAECYNALRKTAKQMGGEILVTVDMLDELEESVREQTHKMTVLLWERINAGK